ncbi:BTAD domain-containing putative transcriptional regulator [Actinokineospora sp. G85]|uniref:AfsR/SARP family transcriptional regulator n=1 Tax=Actinokineospora sp. G85 TaxID=3406626 RepID=UPI003C7574FC
MRFGILGPLAVRTSSGDAVTVPHAKVRALLAVLLLNEGRPVSIDRLAEDLWGEAQPGNPGRALHTKVWQLRRALDGAEAGAGALVVSRPPGYQLSLPPGALDAERFRGLVSRARQETDPRARAAALSEALDLWRGEPLADFGDADFARPAIARLVDERLTALEDRAEVLLDLGEHGPLVAELSDLVAREPLRERLRAAHMRALHGAGRPRDALGSYDDLRRRMAAELGLDPGPEISALRQAMLEQRPGVAAAPRPPGNLPAELSSLVGRDEAVGRVRALLAAGRLVTLTGIGGVGKTRLALAVARSATSPPDGAWLVELGAAARSDAVVDLVADVLGVRDETSATVGGNRAAAVDRVVDSVRAKRTLLVLDNCEHVVDAVAALVERLLKAAPGLRVLATSREPLGVEGERLWPVSPLGLPDPGRPTRCAWPARARCGCSWPVPPPRTPGSAWTSTTRRRSGRSACAWTASRSPSNSPRPGCARWARTRWPPGSATASPCSPRAPATRPPGSGPCARPSTGAGGCSTTRSGRCCAGCRRTAAGATWPPSRPSAPGAGSRRPTCSTWWPGWSTGRWSCPSRPPRGCGTGCWNRWPPTAPSGFPRRARPGGRTARTWTTTSTSPSGRCRACARATSAPGWPGSTPRRRTSGRRWTSPSAAGRPTRRCAW